MASDELKRILLMSMVRSLVGICFALLLSSAGLAQTVRPLINELGPVHTTSTIFE